MCPVRSLPYFLCLIAFLSHRVSSQSFRLPDSGDTCNVVNLNFGDMDENSRARGPQGPPGKRGNPGINGIRGEKGSKGEAGQIGVTPEINIANYTSAVFKAIGATSCEELMKAHGLTETGYYLMRSNATENPVYTYCDFNVRRGISTCQELQLSLGGQMKTGYFLLEGEEDGGRIFLKCHKATPVDCKAANRADAILQNATGGVFDVFPLNEDQNVRVYCDFDTDGGGWTVFQRRIDGSVDFFRSWSDYANGFGEPSGEFWLGLENLHQITGTGPHELRIDLTDWSGNSAYAKYGMFSVGPRAENYRLDVGSYTGTAGDSLTNHDNMQFSTKDADNDPSGSNCALTYYHGGWWYNNCHYSNLNGIYHQGPGTDADGVTWHHWKNAYAYLKVVEMKLRKKN